MINTKDFNERGWSQWTHFVHLTWTRQKPALTAMTNLLQIFHSCEHKGKKSKTNFYLKT